MIRCFPRATGLQPEHYAQPFDQALGSLLIYLFYMHATIRQKYMVFFHLIFLFCTTIRPKIRVLIDLFFMCTRPFDQKIGFSLIYCFYLCTTIRLSQGLLLLFYLFFSQMCQYFVCYIHGHILSQHFVRCVSSSTTYIFRSVQWRVVLIFKNVFC